MATQLWGTDLATSLKKIQSEITDKIEDIQDVPFWKKAAKFIAPFAISALLPGIGTALTGLSGVAGTAGATAAAGGKGILAGLLNLGKSGAGILGKGLSMGKATGIQSFLHGLLSKGGAQAALGGGFRSLIDSNKKINVNDLNLSPLQKLYARDAVKKINKDLSRERKQSKENYLLADLMAAGSGLIPKNPLDILKAEPGYQWGAGPSIYPRINPFTKKPYEKIKDLTIQEFNKGKGKSFEENLTEKLAPKLNTDITFSQFGDTSFIPQFGDRAKSIFSGLADYLIEAPKTRRDNPIEQVLDLFGSLKEGRAKEFY